MAEAPLLQQIYEDYKDDGLMVLAIGLGQNQTQCQNWINNHGITHPVLSDMGYSVWNQFGMGYIPHNAVMDCADVVTFTNYGFNESVIRTRITTALPDMIQFDHDPVQSAPELTPIEISSGISAGSEFSTGFPKLYYRANGALWLSMEMTYVGNDLFVTEIPNRPPLRPSHRHQPSHRHPLRLPHRGTVSIMAMPTRMVS